MGVSFSGLGTREAPILIAGVVTNFEAVSAEYEYLEQQYGPRGVEWKLIRQSLVSNKEGRMCDVLFIELSDSSQIEVWFDITDYLGKF